MAVHQPSRPPDALRRNMGARREGPTNLQLFNDEPAHSLSNLHFGDLDFIACAFQLQAAIDIPIVYRKHIRLALLWLHIKQQADYPALCHRTASRVTPSEHSHSLPQIQAARLFHPRQSPLANLPSRYPQSHSCRIPTSKTPAKQQNILSLLHTYCFVFYGIFKSEVHFVSFSIFFIHLMACAFTPNIATRACFSSCL